MFGIFNITAQTKWPVQQEQSVYPGWRPVAGLALVTLLSAPGYHQTPSEGPLPPTLPTICHSWDGGRGAGRRGEGGGEGGCEQWCRVLARVHASPGASCGLGPGWAEDRAQDRTRERVRGGAPRTRGTELSSEEAGEWGQAATLPRGGLHEAAEVRGTEYSEVQSLPRSLHKPSTATAGSCSSETGAEYCPGCHSTGVSSRVLKQWIL